MYSIGEIPYWKEKGFHKVAEIFKSPRLKQGVDVNFILDRKEYTTSGVYILGYEERVIKIGQSANIADRIFNQYKCIVNSGNNWIREHIKNTYIKINVYAYPTPCEVVDLIGYTFPTNLQKGLEESMLHDFYNQLGKIPELNKQRN